MGDVPIVVNVVWSKCFGTLTHNDSRANLVPAVLVGTASKEEALGCEVQMLGLKASATPATTDNLAGEDYQNMFNAWAGSLMLVSGPDQNTHEALLRWKGKGEEKDVIVYSSPLRFVLLVSQENAEVLTVL